MGRENGVSGWTKGMEQGAKVKPKALDLFCCAGGASMGLYRAGFDVRGVDIRPQPRYPFPFTQMDATSDSLWYLIQCADYDLIWASPPCQRYTMAQNAAKNAHNHPDLIPVIRERLKAWGGTYIIG